MIDCSDLRELRNVIDEARIILNTTALPDGRAIHARELVEHAITITDGLIARPTFAMQKPRGRKVKRQPWLNVKI